MKRAAAPLVALSLAVAIVTGVATAAAPAAVPGSAGVDTSLPATDSKLTVSGRGRFADLKVTVNQTKKLVNQAISVTWEGGRPTRSASTRFHGNYLQMMQCWGDDDKTVPGNPGPPPEQCVQGAASGTDGGVPNLGFPSGSFAADRIITREAWPNYKSTPGHFDSRTKLVWKPFRAVSGTVVDVHKNPEFNPAISGGNFWLNDFFNIITTNEIPGARTGPNGKGAELFQVNTGVESSSLGCGQRVQPVAGGTPKIPTCWLVIVPRGTPAEENVGTPFEENADQAGVVTSPLSPNAWKERVAIPLEFNPVDSPCSLSDVQRRIVGNELIVPAVSSWQPKLCAAPGSPPYAYATVADAAARRQLAAPVPGGPGMIVVSRPLVPGSTDAEHPITYAPLSLSGTVIGFNVERVPRDDAGAEALALGGVRVADINLTPRLVAKLLTQSYSAQTAILQAPPYEWVKKNPPHMGADPDFLQFNAEFNLLRVPFGKNFGGLLLPSRNSDTAMQVWEYVLADPEAKAWLDGAPDQWGMKVNPGYATKATANLSGAAFGDPPPDSFPKSDAHCYQAPPQGQNGSVVPPPLCGTDWFPYTQSLRDAARLTRTADDGARIVLDTLAVSADQAWKRDLPQTLGSRSMLSLTDSVSAAQFGLQMARLSRAGDSRAERVFVAPDTAGLTAGAAAMKARAEPAVREPDAAASAPAAYPLTALTYAAINPLSLDEQSRKEYAAFVDYAAGAGQVAGPELGQLPRGYAPLPASLREQAASAAKTIRELKPIVPTSTTPTTAVPAATATSAVVAAGSPSASETSFFSGPSSLASDLSSSSPDRTPVGANQNLAPATTTTTSTMVRSPVSPTAGFTPVADLAVARFALPALLAIMLLSSLGTLELTKRPRYSLRHRSLADGSPRPLPHAGVAPRRGARLWPRKR